MEHNLCVTCGVDMGADNPRQLCGKTSCSKEGRWTFLLGKYIPDDVSVGWANRLSLAIESAGFSDANEKAQVRRLAYNLPKNWDKLRLETVINLAKMTSAEMSSVTHQSVVCPKVDVDTSSSDGGSWLEEVHEDRGDWFRNY